MSDKMLTMSDLYSSGHNEFHINVLVTKCKGVEWLVRRYENSNMWDEGTTVKNLLMSEDYDRLLELCRRSVRVDLDSGDYNEQFDKEFIEFCKVFRADLIKKGLSEKEAERKRLLDALKKLDEDDIC